MSVDIAGARQLAREIRKLSVTMVYRANASHIGGALSAADILSVLYSHILKVDPRNPGWPERDRFILSKGHCCAALYAVLALRGFFPLEELLRYGEDGTRLLAHSSHHVPGVEWSTGSLGHGLPIACGQAMAARRNRKSWRIYCLLSDGEINEGSTWEAFLFAAHHGLEAITAIIDRNGQQGMGKTRDILQIENLEERLAVFGWDTVSVDGHDLPALFRSLAMLPVGKPLAVIARTVKGKGVPYMEDRLEWHYRPPRTEEELREALRALDPEG
jgi:transketolase